MPSCFTKSCECRFLSPFRYNKSTRSEPEELDPKILIPWHRLSDLEVVWLSPWSLIPKHDIGCEYVNTYNLACSDVFNCNMNVQIGDVLQVYLLNMAKVDYSAITPFAIFSKSASQGMGSIPGRFEPHV